MNSPRLDAVSISHRRELVEMLRSVRRGHLGSAFSIVEILRVLYDEILRVDPGNPGWPDRDRFILSKGHGCLALYRTLAEKGFFPRETLGGCCSFDSILGGHPEHEKIPGVEASTGSLGHGLSIGVGIALSARIDKRDFRTFVLVGDGECNEGSVWEAAMTAAKHRLSSLTVIVDYNHMQCYGKTSEILDLEPFVDKWRSFGFSPARIDGHDVGALRNTLGKLPFDADRPSAVVCDTVKGRGFPSIEGNASWHHKTRVTDEEIGRLIAELEAQG